MHPAVLVDGIRFVGQLRAVLHAGAVQAVILLILGAAPAAVAVGVGAVPVERHVAVGQAGEELCAKLLLSNGLISARSRNQQ